MFVATAMEQPRRLADQAKPGKWRMIVGNAILMLSRSAKSREGDHFQAAIGLAAQLDNRPPVIPDYAHDQHTHKGRRMKRGLAFFRDESTKLVPKPKPDAYEDEAYEVWARKPNSTKGASHVQSDQAEMF